MNVSFDFAAAAVCIILYHFVSMKYPDRPAIRRYRQMVFATLITSVLGITGGLTEDFYGIFSSSAALIFNSVRLLLPAVNSACYIRYVQTFTGESRQSLLERVAFGVLALYVLFIISNAFTGMMFSYSAEAGYIRGGLFNVCYFVPEALIISALLIVGKNAGVFSKSQNLSVFFFAGCTVIGLALETYVFPEISLLCFLISLSYMGMLFSLETPDFAKLEKTMVELELAKIDAETAREDAEEAREEAVLASSAKTKFLANMSHEIRTPINAILGFDEMILRDSSDENSREYAKDIKTAGNTLLALINDILDFSKIESGKLELEPADYSLYGLINEMSDMIGMKASQKGLDFEIITDPSTPEQLFGDELRLKQILLNLLNNAVKYTDKGKITLRIDYLKDKSCISLSMSVSDTGRGIREEDMDRLFNPYDRLDSEANRGIEGTGLGLGITERLLELMGSKLEVSSVYGEGSVFSFTVNQEQKGEAVIGDVKTRRENDHINTMTEHEKGTYLYAPKAKILAVDDTSVNLKVITALLKRTGIDITSAESGVIALELCKHNRYDVILLDHMMPHPDGIETLGLIRTEADSLNQLTPVIVLTANAVMGAREEYLAQGFDDYLSKPVNGEELEQILRKYLDASIRQDVSISQDIGTEELTPEQQRNLEICRGAASNPMLNTEEGLKAAGGNDIYAQVLSDIYDTYSSRAGMIEKYAQEEDLHPYTVQVHALKSIARLAGATELSAEALRLENCGNAGDRGEILKSTPALIEQYLKLGDSLAALFSENVGRAVVDEVQLKEAINAIYEAVENFDFDTADLIMNNLRGVELDEKYENAIQQLKVYMAEVDRDGIMELIDELYRSTGND